MARKYAHRIPFILKINHNQLLTYPNGARQTMFARVEQGWDMGCAAVGATIYFGSDDADREIEEVGRGLRRGARDGHGDDPLVLPAQPRLREGGVDHHTSADLTAQANHLGVTLGADIIKQKLPTLNGGYNSCKGFGKTHKKVYGELVADHPVDYVRWQVANCYMGKIGLINSGGASAGESDLAEAVRTAVINKRGGGMGLISGRKAFQRPRAGGRRPARTPSRTSTSARKSPSPEGRDALYQIVSTTFAARMRSSAVTSGQRSTIAVAVIRRSAGSEGNVAGSSAAARQISAESGRIFRDAGSTRSASQDRSGPEDRIFPLR